MSHVVQAATPYYTLARMDEEATRPDESLKELPLFPLNTVLLPEMPLPLHIFEERYKLMIGRCIEEKSSFGILLINEGEEVGGGADPFDVGTTAHIIQVERLEEGRMNILVRGERRFRLVERLGESPYLVGRVEYLPEEEGIVTAEVLERAQGLFAEYARGMAGLRGGWVRQPKMPQELHHLSYAIAGYLELPSRVRQRLLELPTASERLSQEVPLLERGVEWVKEELVKRRPFTGPRLN